jgi:hypothetical protein
LWVRLEHVEGLGIAVQAVELGDVRVDLARLEQLEQRL